MAEECNVDDILCQLETLRHLRGLQHEMGKDPFKEKFPELEGLDIRIAEEVSSQEENLAEAIEKCHGTPGLAEDMQDNEY